jgi:hypothetical protein
MSRINGDKARFNRVRRQNAAKRKRNRLLLKDATVAAKAARGSEKKPAVA